MLRIGCHLSVSKGYLNMGMQAVSIGANTFQFFTRNPRGGKAKAVDEKDISAYLAYAEEHDIKKILAHAPYTLNPAALDGRVIEFAYETMRDDLRRLEYVPGNYYNFHPGSHVGQGIDKGIELISDLLNEIITETQSTTVLLETMSGKGSEVGSKFEEIAAVIGNVRLKDKIGVCLDTCHIYDAGYDIAGDIDGVIEEFDRIIGLEKLYAIHINDTKNPFSSHKDRHEKIGEGHLGIDALSRVINHEKLRDLPFYLETPNELDGYKQEIELLRSLYKD